MAKKTRLTSHQVQTANANRKLHWDQYKVAHKAATAEYALYKQAGTHKLQANTAAAVAARWDTMLSAENPWRIEQRPHQLAGVAVRNATV